MSKFFDQTAKLRNSALGEQSFDVAGLGEVATVEEQINPEAIDFSDELRGIEPNAKVEILESKLLPAKFEGSAALKSAAESYLALRTRLMRLHSTRALRSVVVTSSIPGEGKTLTSFNLALCCSQLPDFRVLLIDGDIRTAGLSKSLGFSSLPGLADALSGKCSPESAVLETNRSNLFVCAAGSAAEPPAELYAGHRWQEFIRWCTESFSLVLVDSPPIIALADVELMMAACDGALWVVRARHTHRDVLQKAASQMDTKKVVGIVYNNSETTQNNYYSATTKEE
jgi:protein-tyrosine kinase